MNDIVVERSGSILDVSFNRPAKKNALTMSMYATFAALLNEAAKAEGQEVTARVRSAEAREAFTAFFEKRRQETR